MAAKPVPGKVIVTANTAWYLYNFRLNLMHRLQSKGFEVVAVAPHDEYVAKLAGQGIRHVPLAMHSSGTNPIEDLGLLYRYYRLLRQEKPNIILSYTPKPNIYASIAAGMLGIPVICNIAGLGRLFIQAGPVTRIAKLLYKFALRRVSKVFFQNDEDMSSFLEEGLVKPELAERIPGSGVDTRRFVPAGEHVPGDRFTFLLSGRLLWDKGVGEYVAAARLLRKKHPDVRFQLLGFTGVDNPSAVTMDQVQNWVDEGIIEYLGVSDDVVSFLARADCIVLPSYYREGVPRSLLEAAAMAKPIITCDSIGCRDVVDDGINGFLCLPKSVDDLADKMIKMIELSAEERQEMGEFSREKAVREFDEAIMISKYIQVIDDALASQHGKSA